MSACLVVCAYVLAPTNPAVIVVVLALTTGVLPTIAIAESKFWQHTGLGSRSQPTATLRTLYHIQGAI